MALVRASARARAGGRRGLARLRPRAPTTAARCTPTATPREVGDEPLLIAARTGAPVFVGARRVDAARALLRAPSGDAASSSATTACSTMRWRATSKSACSTTAAPATAGCCRPGRCASPGRGRCDLVLHTGDAAGLRRLRRRSARWPITAAARRRRARSPLGGAARPAAASRSPASRKPEALLRTCCATRGLALAALHRPARPPRFRRLRPAARHGPTLLCTEKDAVKLWRRGDPTRWAAAAGASTPELRRLLRALLDAKLSSLDGHQAA